MLKEGRVLKVKDIYTYWRFKRPSKLANTPPPNLPTNTP